MNAFKYYGSFGLNVLTEGRIKLSRADLLNDPFELSPSIDASLFTLERAMQFLRQDSEITRWYRVEGARGGFTNKKKFRRWYLSNLRERAAALMPKVPENVESARQRFAESFSQFWRLFCVTTNPASILMWSHYANHHKGMVIEFDLSAPPFNTIGEEWILPVQYSSEKASFSYKPGDQRNFTEAIKRVASRKSNDWSYESEIRVMVAATACLPGDFLPLSASAIRRVILGCRFSSEDASRVKTVLGTPELSHVRLEQALLSRGKFELEVVPFDASA